MKRILLALVLMVAIAAVGWWIWNGQKAEMPADGQGYKDIAYNIDGRSIALTDGYAETDIIPGSASKIVTIYFGNEARGDINGDGKEDVVFILTQTAGGSGTFYYAVAALAAEPGYRGLGGVLLGDRIAPQSTEIADGRIIVNYADREPGEPMTDSPSRGVTKYLRVAGDSLIESE